MCRGTQDTRHKNRKILANILALDGHPDPVLVDRLCRPNVELAGLARHRVNIVPPVIANYLVFAKHLQNREFEAEIGISRQVLKEVGLRSCFCLELGNKNLMKCIEHILLDKLARARYFGHEILVKVSCSLVFWT